MSQINFDTGFFFLHIVSTISHVVHGIYKILTFSGEPLSECLHADIANLLVSVVIHY